MQIFKKEKRVVELALEHADKTAECLAIMTSAVKAFITTNNSNLDKATRDVNELETAADGLLRDIRELLYSGAYLPTIRGDLYRLVSAVDSIANRVEGCLDFVNTRRPESTETFGAEFDQILDMTVDCHQELVSALRAFFKPKGKVDELRAHTAAVGKLESNIDDNERKLVVTIFRSELELAEKQEIAALLSRIARISDQIENTADELELLSLKSII